MEPVISIVSAIFKALQEIAKAGREARRNRTRCRELAWRAQVVSDVLRDARNDDGGGAAAATRRVILCRLREALDDALKLVESCGWRDDDGCLSSSWFSSLFSSGARAARFDDVDKRINNCLVELSAASGASIEKKIDGLAVASGGDRHPGANKPNEIKAGNAPQKGATGQGAQTGGKGGGKRRRGKKKKKKKKKKAAGSRPPPPPVAHAGALFQQNGHGGYTVYHHHLSFEEDPNSCSVM